MSLSKSQKLKQEHQAHASTIVRDVMSPRVVAVTSVTFLPEAAKIMKDEDLGALPVVQEDGTLMGIVTDRDITVRAVAEGKDVARTQIAEIYSADELVTLSPDTTLVEAEAIMADKQVRRLPIVDEASKVVGILTLADIAKATASNEATQVLRGVVEPGGEHNQVAE